MTRLELLQMSDSDSLWVAGMDIGATGHRSEDRRIACCGAEISGWPVTAGQLARLSGDLCPRCWSPQPTETPAHPGR